MLAQNQEGIPMVRFAILLAILLGSLYVYNNQEMLYNKAENYIKKEKSIQQLNQTNTKNIEYYNNTMRSNFGE